MKVNEAYPSRYLAASDLNGVAVTVTIASVELEEIGIGADKDKKLVLSFAGKKKAFVMNKTNAKTVAGLYGDETDNWIGQRITIAPREVEYQGEMILALRVSLQKPAAVGAAPATEPAPAPAAGGATGEDSPF